MRVREDHVSTHQEQQAHVITDLPSASADVRSEDALPAADRATEQGDDAGRVKGGAITFQRPEGILGSGNVIDIDLDRATLVKGGRSGAVSGGLESADGCPGNPPSTAS